MMTGEDLYCKVHQSPTIPRVVLTPNLQYGRQDPPDCEVRKSTDHHSEQSVQDTVKRLNQHIENHPSRDSLIKGLNRTEEFNPFSKKSKELITIMGNTEYSGLCETSSKIQCPDCASCWEAGIKNCACGKFIQPTKRIRQLNKARYDVLSIPGFVIKESYSRCQTWTICATGHVLQST